MPMSPFPGPVPSTSDPANFNARADATLGHLPTFVTEANALQADVNAAAIIVSQDSIAAQNAAIAAAQSVASAAAAAGAVKWVSGTSYAQGVVVWSPSSYLSYRRKTAGAGTTDPSVDEANWALIGSPVVLPLVSISTNTVAVPGLHYMFTATLTLTLPPSPSVRDAIQFTDFSGSRSSIINPNGKLMRGVGGSMVINLIGAGALLVYSGAAKGWI